MSEKATCCICGVAIGVYIHPDIWIEHGHSLKCTYCNRERNVRLACEGAREDTVDDELRFSLKSRNLAQFPFRDV